MTSTTFDKTLDRLDAGGRLDTGEIRTLAASPDVLQLGMLADASRRQRHGRRATYVRVAERALDAPATEPLPDSAGEVRLTGRPGSLDAAVAGIRVARTLAGARILSGFSWPEITDLAGAATLRVADVLQALRDAGLDALAPLPIDAIDAGTALRHLRAAGFDRVTLGIAGSAPADPCDLWEQAAALHAEHGGVEAIDPLPSAPGARLSTGYQDVRSVAIARLMAHDVPHIRVDWRRHGPKLAQVALTFGADDVWGVSASDDAPEGRRRAPLEEIRRNIEAAGFEPVERPARGASA